MQGMQGGVLLVSGYVLLVTLAAPTALVASEDPDGTPVQPVENTAQPAAPPYGAEDTVAEQLDPVTVPAKGGREQDATAAATRTVAMRDIKFKPRNITIDRGDTVRWENEDAEKHNAIGEDDSFETPVIDQGETSQHTFNGGGKIDYFCTLHANMDGTITVRGSGGGGGGSGGGGGGTTESGSTGGTAAPGSDSGSSGSGSTGSGFSGTTGTTSSSSSSSSLPVTGVDLLWLVLAGYGLLTFGATLWLLVVREE
jgi:plastocyanin